MKKEYSYSKTKRNFFLVAIHLPCFFVALPLFVLYIIFVLYLHIITILLHCFYFSFTFTDYHLALEGESGKPKYIPGSIANYEPGKSSISEREKQLVSSQHYIFTFFHNITFWLIFSYFHIFVFGNFQIISIFVLTKHSLFFIAFCLFFLFVSLIFFLASFSSLNFFSNAKYISFVNYS